MSLKLYRVEISTAIFVVAESDIDAERIAQSPEVELDDQDVWATEVTHRDFDKGGWKGTAIPWGEQEGDKTLDEYLAELPSKHDIPDFEVTAPTKDT